MERLQAAIEKARAQREATGQGDFRTDPLGDPGGEPGAAPRRPPPARPRPPEARAPEARAPEPRVPESRVSDPRASDPAVSVEAEAVEATWRALRQLETRDGTFDRSRVVAHAGGREAAPYDLLRTRMLQQARKNGWRRIALVSPHSGSGKTTTAANLIFSFGRQRDLSTLVLDFDLRRAGLSKLLGQSLHHGMEDVLEGRVSFADHGLRLGSNVAIGLNRGPTANPSELLQSRRTPAALDELEAALSPDLVLFDMPAMMASDDNYGFLRNVDCALMLAAAEQTSMDVIDVTEREIAELTDVMGIVLNKCRYTDGAYGYEYAYD